MTNCDESSPDFETSACERMERFTLEIIQNWDQKVRIALPVVSKHDTTVIHNGLPEFLSNLARDLSPPQSQHHPIGSLRLARQHGKERASISDYSLNQVLLEYHLLRKSIVEVLQAKGPLTDHERDIIHDSLDRGIAEAGEAFVEAKLAYEKKNVEILKKEKELRDQFIYTLTHDLRTPLTAAMLNAQTIVHNPETNEKNRQLCAKLLANVERIDRMIQDLLDSNRVRMGQKIALQIAPCDLQKVAQEVLEQASSLYGARFKLCSSEVVQGHWDCDALRRAMENLIQNAVKYGGKESPIILALHQSELETWLSVHNDGNPIPKEYQSSLFEPFRRIDLPQQTGTKGWGIGLNLVRGVAEAHGGHVQVESSPEKGTTFTLTFPVNSSPFQTATEKVS